MEEMAFVVCSLAALFTRCSQLHPEQSPLGGVQTAGLQPQPGTQTGRKGAPGGTSPCQALPGVVWGGNSIAAGEVLGAHTAGVNAATEDFPPSGQATHSSFSRRSESMSVCPVTPSQRSHKPGISFLAAVSTGEKESKGNLLPTNWRGPETQQNSLVPAANAPFQGSLGQWEPLIPAAPTAHLHGLATPTSFLTFLRITFQILEFTTETQGISINLLLSRAELFQASTSSGVKSWPLNNSPIPATATPEVALGGDRSRELDVLPNKRSSSLFERLEPKSPMASLAASPPANNVKCVLTLGHNQTMWVCACEWRNEQDNAMVHSSQLQKEK
ncbi:hypothetical protein EK904_003520 [Melospiza melodia maxima]|nr:hypothetical protein EK904_003520 [Melospiza melodia maxima]